MEHPAAMAQGIVLSHYQAAPLLAAQKAGQETAVTSPDLGLSTLEVTLAHGGVTFPGGEMVRWEDLHRIVRARNQCFAVADGGVRSIQVYSETTHWLRALMATESAPTMLVAGFPMHRIKDTDPWQDTLKKARAIAPLTGAVLDTATGLGYTAIAAARTAERVVTVELDPAGLEIARQNPWSRDLFTNPSIHQIVGDVFTDIQRFADGEFTRALHDPPTFSLAGELYSAEFYRQVYRVLTRTGRLFHYVGDPTSGLGKRVTAGVVRRLREVGFRRVEPHPGAFGVVAHK
jgi:predicted methyltransferase